MSLLDDIRASQRTSGGVSLLDAIRAESGGKPDSPALRSIVTARAPMSAAEARTRDTADREVADARQGGGFVDRMGDLFVRGARGLDAGLARSVSVLSPFDAVRSTERGAAQQFERVSNAPVAGEQTWEMTKANPTASGLGRFVLDQSVGSAPGMIVAASGIPGTIAYGVTQAGNIGQQRAENDGRGDATFGDVVAAAPAATASALLERVGIGGIFGATGRNAITRIGKAAATEGVTEFGQSVVENAGGTLATERGFSPTEALDQGFAGAVAGVGMGGALRTTEEGGTASYNKWRSRPDVPGVRDVAGQSVEITPEDVASPIPTDLIAKGKSELARAGVGSVADNILSTGGLPTTGKRVSVQMPGGETMTGTVQDAIDTDAGALGRAQGVKIAMDDGSTFAEHFDTIRDAGVKIAELSSLAEADALDEQLRQRAQEPVKVAPAPRQMPSTAIAVPTPTGGTVGSDSAIDNFMRKTRTAESGGRDNAKNPNSSARGRYQFTDATWLTTYRREFGDTNETNEQILAKKSDGGTQDRLMRRLTRENAQALAKAGLPVDEGTLYLAHFAGEAGARKVLKADPNASIESVLGAKAVAANPFLAGKTAGETAAWAVSKMGGASPSSVPASPSTLIEEARASQAPENQGGDLRGDPIDKEWVRFAPETGTLDVPRAEMPQVAAEHRGALVNFLGARGIAHEEQTVPADSLKPTQAEFSTAKVAKAKAFTGGDRAILVSSDGHVVDGHHQWVAKRDAGQEVRVIKLDAPIRDLLAIVPEMPSATMDGGGTPASTVKQDLTDAPAAESSTPAPQISAPPAPENASQSSALLDAPVPLSAATVEDMPSGTSFIVRGASPADMAAITAALPRGVKPLPNSKLGGMVFAKKHRRAVRAALFGGDRRNPGFRDRRDDIETDLLTFVAANGSIRDDEGHDLRKGRGLQKFIPGQGALIRKDGRSVDAMRERLVESGWLPETATVADTLDLIERASRAPVYHPASERNVAAQTDGKESQDEGRERLQGTIDQMGLVGVIDEDIAAAMTRMGDGDTPVAAILGALDERYSRDGADIMALADEGASDIPGFDDAEIDPDARRTRNGGEVAAPQARDGAGGERPARAGEGARTRERESGSDGRDQEALTRSDAGNLASPAPAPPGDPVYDDGGQQIGWLDVETGAVSSITDAQRSEMAARAQQSMIRRGGQEAVSDQEGGLFDAARDQATMFSRTFDPVSTITGDELGVQFNDDSDFRALIAGAQRWYRANLVGRTIKMVDGVPVTFSTRGLRETTHNKGDVLLRLVPAIPDILAKGTIMPEQPGDRANIRSIVWVKAPVNFMGKEITVAVAVRQHSDGKHRQYTLTNVDWLHEGVGGRSSRTEGAAESVPDQKSPPTGINIRLVEDDANGDSAISDVRSDLTDRLRAIGISDRVSLEAVERFADGRIAGSYQEQLISVALGSSQAPIDTLNHEAIHALRDLGLFRDPEWASLSAAARADTETMASVSARYPNLSKEQLLEEAVADRFMLWSKGQRERGFVGKAFERVRDFLRALGVALRGKGFTTAEGVMRAIERGAVGVRSSQARLDPSNSELRDSMPAVEPSPTSIFFRPEVTNTAAFKQWFAGSKVTFNDGKTPLVMFHGTSRNQDGDAFTIFDTYASNYGLMGQGGYFTADPDVASQYTRKGRGDAPTVYPVYLAIKNPLDMDASADRAKWIAQFDGIEDFHEGGDTNESWYRAAEDLVREEMLPRWEGAEIMQDGLRGMGYDGITHLGGGRVDPNGPRHRVFIAFDPEQIKSATGNRGSFDPTSADMRHSIVGAIKAAASGPKADAFYDGIDRWRTALQDRYLPLMRTQRIVEQQLGRPLSEDENPYLNEELMSGRMGARLQELADEKVEPLLAAIHEEGVAVEELEEFLYARHAPERNARIAKINPTFQQGEGSGMTDVEAAQVMSDVAASGKRPAMDRLAARVDKILADALQTRVDAGLMSQGDANLWRQQYQHYVPLRGQSSGGKGAGLSGRISQQSGISVKGKESRQAFGRASKADSILAYAILQAEEAIVRAEKNIVAKSFLDLAQSAPDPNFWKVDKVERRAVFNKASGMVEYQNQTRISAEDAPYTVSVKVDGVEHRVTMNRDNEAAARLAASMRNLDEQKFGAMVRTLGAYNRFLSTMSTTMNPEFVITNAFRDIQSASINLSADHASMVAGTLKDYRAALVASVKGSFGKGSGSWDQWYREFVMDGGRTFFNHVEDLEGIKRRLDNAMAIARKRAAGQIDAKRIFLTAREAIEGVNNGVENAIRLAAYKNAREGGMSRKRAASLAKNLTVNFNRRGTMGPFLNAAYLFFNASIQGTARMLTALQSPRVRKIMFGVAIGGFALEILNGLVSGDDDDGESFYDKISGFEKERNLIIMWPQSDGKYAKIPLPYGFNIFHNLGRTLGEVARRGGDRWPESASGFANSLVSAFNPIGGNESLLNLIMPTIVDPIIDLWADNRDYADKPIMPDENRFGPKEPDAQRYFGSGPALWRPFTDTLTKLSGGDDVVAGAIDVSPETLEYLSGVAFGAAGAFIERSVSLTKKVSDPEQEISISDVPLARKLVGSKPAWYDKSAYYDRVGQIDEEVAAAKDYVEREDWDSYDAFIDRHPYLIQMEKITKAAKKEMRAIRKMRNESEFALEMGRIDEDLAAKDKAYIKERETYVVETYNGWWNDIVLGKAKADTD